MASTPLRRTVLKNEVGAILRDEIAQGLIAPGEKLPSLKALAARFGTSTFTIRSALDRLEEAGAIERRHGAGTYVTGAPAEFTLADSIVLCMEATGHIFGDFHAMLLEKLHSAGRLSLSVDTTHPDKHELLRRAAASEARVLLVHGNASFPYSLLTERAFIRKTIIGVMNWHSDALVDRIHRVVVDERAAGALAAEYLWARGHRRVLIAGTHNMIESALQDIHYSPHYGRIFVKAWEARGGTVCSLQSDTLPDGEIAIAAPRLLERLGSPAKPTAVFALRDIEAWTIQNILLCEAPARLRELDLLGYGNTPWSRAGHPPFTTLDWNLEQLAAGALRLIEMVEGTPALEPVCLEVAPRLVVRGEEDLKERSRP